MNEYSLIGRYTNFAAKKKRKKNLLVVWFLQRLWLQHIICIHKYVEYSKNTVYLCIFYSKAQITSN